MENVINLIVTRAVSGKMSKYWNRLHEMGLD